MVGAGLLLAFSKLCEDLSCQASALPQETYITQRELAGYSKIYATVVISRVGKHRQASLLVYLRIQLISKWFCLADKSGRDLNHDYYSLCSTTPLNSCYELMHTQDLVGKNTPKASACGTCLADRACRESMAQSGPDT